jgi:hypothetical protein
MNALIEFVEAYWAPLFLGAAAIGLMIVDAPIGALICAFGAGHFFRENP